ncbi:hypothetical protein CHUAL_013372 [Chamberlinius hualienensis]
MEDEWAKTDENTLTTENEIKVDWQMETVSLELDNEQNGDARQVCDTVVYEQELDAPLNDQRVVQRFFAEAPPSVFDEIDSSEIEQGHFDDNITANMISSYYGGSNATPKIPIRADNDLAESNLECVTVSIPDDSPVVTEMPNLENLILDSGLEPIPDASTSSTVSVTNLEPVSDNLSKLFAEDKFGSDKEGKAFFDVFSQGISLANVNETSEAESFNSAFLKSGEYYDAWIPKPNTKKILSTLKITPNAQFPDSDLLTMPGVIITEDLKDPVRDLTKQYLGEEAASQRVILTADSVSQDEEGLLKLVSLGYYRAAVNLTTRLLNSFGQGLNRTGIPSTHTPLSLQVWLVRLTLLTKLRLFNMAEAEGEPFGDLDKPDLYYDFYPDSYGGRKGSMVPFALRVLLAQINTCVGKYGEALDRLYTILGIVLNIIENVEQQHLEDGSVAELSEVQRQESLALWKRREEKVLYTIVNCLVAQNDFLSAYSLLESILAKSPANIATVKSAQGHVLLQLGDLKAARQLFNSAASARGTQPNDVIANLIEKASLSIASNSFLDGYCVLKEAQTIDPHHPIVVNNMAVCLLYMGKLRAACQLLENAINSNPKLYLHECVLVNICTLYDLESSRSLQKKSNILDIVNRHSGDGFNGFCLKLPAPS